LIFYVNGSGSSRSSSASTRRPAALTVAAAPTPAPNADRDGVPYSRDNCPDTPRNYAVDANGYPIPIEEVSRIEFLVNFDFDRSNIQGSRVSAQGFGESQPIASNNTDASRAQNR